MRRSPLTFAFSFFALWALPASAVAPVRTGLPAFSELAALGPQERDAYLLSLTAAFSAPFGKDLVTVPNQKCVSRRACHPGLYGDGICLVESAKTPQDFCREKRRPGTFFLSGANASAWMKLQLNVTILCTKSAAACTRLRAVPRLPPKRTR